MSEKIYKYFFFFFLSIITLIILLVTFNSDLRRSILHAGINSYKVYMIVSIQSDLKQDIPDFLSVNNKEKQIVILAYVRNEFSQGQAF